jgi:surface antigen/peptidoglycan hydrolase CwlO-like protein
MKRRFTTPVSFKGIAMKTIFMAMALVTVMGVSFSSSSYVQADKFDDQIEALQREIDAYTEQARQLGDQRDSLQAQLEIYSAERAQIQAGIEVSQARYEQLQNQIKQTEDQILQARTALGETLASIYIDDQISPLEMLASSQTIGAFIDRQEYRNTIRDQLSIKIAEIQELRLALEQQKTDVERTLGDQQNARNALVQKEQEQQQLVTQTQGQQSAFQTLAAETNERKLEIQRQQQAAIEAAIRAASGGTPANILPGDPNKGGYPWEDGCWVDENAISHGGYNGNGGDPLGYGCRQCVSYTAWKVLQKTQYEPRWWGNANMWPASARAAGFSTGTTPKVGAVGVISAGQYGHVVWIEAVNGDGTVDVSQYNFYNAGGSGWGHYSEMRVSSATYDTYIYF